MLAHNKILNCSFIIDQRNYSSKIVRISHFSRNSLFSNFIECIVHIDFRIYVNIKTLNVIEMNLLTWSNCLFQNIIIWMFQMSERIYLANEIRFATFRVCFHVWTINQFNAIQQHIYIAQNVHREKNQLVVSKRSWKKTRNNVTNVHRIQHLTN